jgi:mono/diheme cytochrome c family protein
MLQARQQNVARFIISFSMFALFAGCGESTSENAEETLSHAAGEVDLSELSGIAYYQNVCATCHGRNGEGALNGPQVQQPIYDYAIWVVRNGRTMSDGSVMPDFSESDLSEVQLIEMLTWLRSVQKPTTGSGLYEVYCSHCHGEDGRGGESNQDITHDAHRSSEIFSMVRDGHGGTDYQDRSKYMPSWNDLDLSDQEVNLMIGYLQELAR